MISKREKRKEWERRNSLPLATGKVRQVRGTGGRERKRKGRGKSVKSIFLDSKSFAAFTTCMPARERKERKVLHLLS